MTQFLSRRRALIGLGAISAALPLSACETLPLDPSILNGLGTLGALSQADAAGGIRAALNNGIGNAIANCGVKDGFLGNSLIRIPLPGALRDVQSVLAPIGAGGLLTELETQLNRGAEQAVPVARDIFVDTVSNLSITDAINLVQGGGTTATDFLQTQTTPRLTSLFSPIMESALGNTGALQLVSQLDQTMRNLPFVTPLSNAKGSLIEHGVGKGLDGMFHFIGEEEKAIRANPAKRTSEILRRVFS